MACEGAIAAGGAAAVVEEEVSVLSDVDRGPVSVGELSTLSRWAPEPGADLDTG